MPPDELKTFLGRLKGVYSGMDAAYEEARRRYGFSCSGCGDNCCTQRFFHYTLAEYLCLMEGVRALDSGRRAEAFMRAKEVTDAYPRELEAGKIEPLMCPLNFDGPCAVYASRPMICRAHGLPHKFRRPDGRTVDGGGCARFDAAHKADFHIDRTAFYAELAGIEKELRASLGFAGRYMKTTAQMLVDMAADMSGEAEGKPSQT